MTWAVIHSDFDKGTVLEAQARGDLAPLYPAKQAKTEDIESAAFIVGQMWCRAIHRGA